MANEPKELADVMKGLRLPVAYDIPRLKIPPRIIDKEDVKRRQLEREERDRLSQIEQTKAAIQGMINRSNIPKRLTQKDIDFTLSKMWMEKHSMLSAKLGAGFLHALIGGYGTGKSQMGVQLILSKIDKFANPLDPTKHFSSVPAMFVHAPEMLDSIKDVYRSDKHETIKGALSHYTLPELLVIDELNSASQADVRYIHRIICQRYDDMTDTLLISNETKHNFQTLIGDRVVSRMIECGGIIETNWPSFRSAKTGV